MQPKTAKASSALAAEYIRELDSEVRATRECLAQIPLDKFDWKPHEKSMNLGYLSILVADIPKWISKSIEDKVIDLATYEHYTPKTTEELVEHFDKNVELAQQSLSKISDQGLKETFSLKKGDQLLFSAPMDENISSCINHLVHHRGQLSVYMRLLDIPVPSIYGPSADTPIF